MSLAADAETIRTQLGIASGTPIAQIINEACVQLGIADECAGDALIAKSRRCMEVLGFNSGTHGAQSVVGAVVLGMPVEAVPVMPAAIEPAVPDISGTYDGPEGLAYIVTAGPTADSVRVRVLQRGRDISQHGTREMRHQGGTVWQGVLPRHVHGGATLYWTFDPPAFQTFTSTAHTKPPRRWTKRAAPPAVQHMDRAAGPIQRAPGTLRLTLADGHAGRSIKREGDCCLLFPPPVFVCCLCAQAVIEPATPVSRAPVLRSSLRSMWLCSSGLSLGEEHEALQVHWEPHSGVLNRPEACDQRMHVQWGKYQPGTEVLSFKCGLFPCPDNETWQLHGDGTIHPRNHPHLAIGMRHGDNKTILVHESDPRKLVFAEVHGGR